MFYKNIQSYIHTLPSCKQQLNESLAYNLSLCNVSIHTYYCRQVRYIEQLLLLFRADVFYLYEPLDSVYQAMYGVGEGWTIPADVTTHLNGSLR